MSLILQYLSEVKYNLAASDVFAMVVKVTNLTELWDAELTWYSLRTTHCICFSDSKHSYKIHCLSPTWPCLIEVFTTEVKFFKPSDYWTVIYCVFIFCIINVFGCFCRLMAQFEHIKCVPKLDYIAHLSVSNHTWSEAMHYISVRQLPWYN